MTLNPFRAIAIAACLAFPAGLVLAQDQSPAPAQPVSPPTDHTDGPIRSDGHNRVYHEPAPVDPNAPVGKMTFDNNVHDFGHIVDTDPVSYDFPFRNTGDGDLVVNSINSTCGCTVAELAKTIYKPGEEGAITITFNPSGKHDKQTKRITVQSNDRDQPTIVLQVVATIEQLVAFEPGVLSFGNLRKGEVQSRIIAVIGRSPDFALSEVSIIGNTALSTEIIGSEEVELADGSKGRRIEIEVTTDGTAKPGPFQGQLCAKTSDSRRPEANANIAGAVMRDVVSDVERLPIGVLTPGKSFERIIRVENRLGKPFTFKGAELKAPIGENQVNWEVLPPAEGAEAGNLHAYDLKVTITAGPKTGALRGTLVLKTDVADEDSIEVPFWGTVRAEKK